MVCKGKFQVTCNVYSVAKTPSMSTVIARITVKVHGPRCIVRILSLSSIFKYSQVRKVDKK